MIERRFFLWFWDRRRAFTNGARLRNTLRTGSGLGLRGGCQQNSTSDSAAPHLSIANLATPERGNAVCKHNRAYLGSGLMKAQITGRKKHRDSETSGIGMLT